MKLKKKKNVVRMITNSKLKFLITVEQSDLLSVEAFIPSNIYSDAMIIPEFMWHFLCKL